MAVAERDARFAAEVHHARLGSVRLLHFSYGAGVGIASAPLGDFATIHLPLAGALHAEHGGERITARPGRGVVFSPDGDVAMDWSAGLRLLVVRIERATLDARLRALLGREPSGPLRFAPALDPRGILGAVTTAQAALAAAGPGGLPPLVTEELERSIVAALLLGQPHTYTVRARRSAVPARARASSPPRWSAPPRRPASRPRSPSWPRRRASPSGRCTRRSAGAWAPPPPPTCATCACRPRARRCSRPTRRRRPSPASRSSTASPTPGGSRSPTASASASRPARRCGVRWPRPARRAP